MAKKAAKKAKSAKKPLAVQMRASAEWRKWLDRLASFKHMPTSILVEQALIEYARNHGFTELPPAR